MIDDLIKKLNKSPNRIYIQTHDFPDPDAIASAYGFQNYLSIKGIESKIVYSGDIQRDALKNMIKKLDIELYKSCEIKISPMDLIIIVDGCKWNKNVTDLPGFEIGVIDHHIVKNPDDVPFLEIRDEIGACSTIITEYFSKENLPVDKNCATALMVGISRDTDLLTRKVTQNDIDAYNYLYKFADNTAVNSLLRNNIQLSDLIYFSESIKNLQTRGKLAWLYFENGCDTNLMGIIGDFILSTQEIEFSIIFAKNANSISISIRNENEEWNGAEIIKKITEGIGAGGGHLQMAGGVIFKSENFSLKTIMEGVERELFD